MKVERERNPYLKRILSQQPHKYSYTTSYSAITWNPASTTSWTPRANILQSTWTEPWGPNSKPTSADSSTIKTDTYKHKSTPQSFTSHQTQNSKPNIFVPGPKNLEDTPSSPINLIKTFLSTFTIQNSIHNIRKRRLFPWPQPDRIKKSSKLVKYSNIQPPTYSKKVGNLWAYSTQLGTQWLKRNPCPNS